MRSRPYRIFIDNQKLINCVSIKDVKQILYSLSNGRNDKLKNVEVFDPITGWDFAFNWIELKNQNDKYVLIDIKKEMNIPIENFCLSLLSINQYLSFKKEDVLKNISTMRKVITVSRN